MCKLLLCLAGDDSTLVLSLTQSLNLKSTQKTSKPWRIFDRKYGTANLFVTLYVVTHLAHCRPSIEKLNQYAPQHSRLFKEVRYRL